MIRFESTDPLHPRSRYGVRRIDSRNRSMKQTNQQAVTIASLLAFFAPSRRISPRDHQLHGPGNINVQHRLFMILNWNYNLLWHVSERINFSGTGKVVRVWCAFHSGFFPSLSLRYSRRMMLMLSVVLAVFFRLSSLLTLTLIQLLLAFISSTSITSRERIKIVNLKFPLINGESLVSMKIDSTCLHTWRRGWTKPDSERQTVALRALLLSALFWYFELSEAQTTNTMLLKTDHVDSLATRETSSGLTRLRERQKARQTIFSVRF